MGRTISFADKSQLDGDYGFRPLWMPDFLIDFQSAMVEWACRKGRAALFEDCGLRQDCARVDLGRNVVRMTNSRVLLAAPLAVALQIVREAQKFGIDVHLSRGLTLNHPASTSPTRAAALV